MWLFTRCCLPELASFQCRGWYGLQLVARRCGITIILIFSILTLDFPHFQHCIFYAFHWYLHQEKWPIHPHSGRQLSCNGGLHSNIWYVYDKSYHHLWYFDHCNILTFNYRPNHRHPICSWTLFCPPQHKQYQSESWYEISSDIVVVSFSIAMNIFPESFRCHRRWQHYDHDCCYYREFYYNDLHRHDSHWKVNSAISLLFLTMIFTVVCQIVVSSTAYHHLVSPRQWWCLK